MTAFRKYSLDELSDTPDGFEAATSKSGFKIYDPTELYDTPPKVVPEEDSSRGILGTAKDVGISALKGAIGVGESGVGLLDIPTGGRVGKAAEDYLGYKPSEAKDILSTFYTPAQKEAQRKVDEAQGFIGTIKEAVKNPSTVAHAAIESAPLMGAGGVIGKGVAAVSKIAPWIAAAIGEGAVGAGITAEDIRQQSKTGRLTPKQSAISVASGIGTGAFNLVGGRLAKKFGFQDIDTLLVSGKRTVSKEVGSGIAVKAGDVGKRILQGGISEGVFEELPQSIQEQVWLNAALSRPLFEGVENAAAMGLLTGAAMGAGANILSGKTTKDEAPPVLTGEGAVQGSEDVFILNEMSEALKSTDPEINITIEQALALKGKPRFSHLSLQIDKIVSDFKSVNPADALKDGPQAKVTESIIDQKLDDIITGKETRFKDIAEQTQELPIGEVVDIEKQKAEKIVADKKAAKQAVIDAEVAKTNLLADEAIEKDINPFDLIQREKLTTKEFKALQAEVESRQTKQAITEPLPAKADTGTQEGVEGEPVAKETIAITQELNKQFPGHDIKYDGEFPGVGHQFTPQSGEFKGRTFTAKELSIESVLAKIQEQFKVEPQLPPERVIKAPQKVAKTGILVEHGSTTETINKIRQEGFKVQKARMPEYADWPDSVFVVKRGGSQTKILFEDKIDAIISDDAKILVEGSKDFKRLSKGLKAPGTADAPEVAHRALKEGYDVVQFNRQDTGIVVMNDKVLTVEQAPKAEAKATSKEPKAVNESKKYDGFLKLAADTPAELRPVDVDRIMDAANDAGQVDGFTKWLLSKDLQSRTKDKVSAWQAESDIEITGKEDKTVKVDIPIKDANALKPKEQKAYLLKEIDVAIKAAPEQEGYIESGGTEKYKTSGSKAIANKETFAQNVEKFGKVTIEVPGDGEFTLLNTKESLKAFKKKISGFPATDVVSQKKVSLPGTKTLNKRIIDFAGEYSKPYTPKKSTKLIEANEMKEFAGYYGEGFYIPGQYVVKMPKPVTKRPLEEAPEAFKTDMLGIDSKDLYEAEIGNETYRNPDGDRNGMTLYVSASSSEMPTQKGYKPKNNFDPEILDIILGKFPKAKSFMNSGGNLYFLDDGDIVGLIMPLSQEYVERGNVQFSTTEDLTQPGKGLTPSEIQSQFPGTKTFIQDGIISILFPNGKGVRILSTRAMPDGTIQYAIDSGRMSSTGKILGAAINDDIYLDPDIAGKKTVWHEQKHIYDYLGMIRPQENVALMQEFRKLRQEGKLDFNPSELKNLKKARDENLANIFAQVMDTRENYRKTRLGRMIQRILDFLDGIRFIGRSSLRKLAREAETGKIFSRKVNGKTVQTSIPAYEQAAEQWYSALVNAVDNVQQKAMPAQQWKALLESNKFKQAGVKSDEIEWSGVLNFLEGKGKVTKQEVLAYLSENNVRVEEVVKGKETFEITEALKKEGVKEIRLNTDGAMFKVYSNWVDFEGVEAFYNSDGFSWQAYEDAKKADKIARKTAPTSTKFSQYLSPWNISDVEGYKEILMTLPGKLPGDFPSYDVWVKNKTNTKKESDDFWSMTAFPDKTLKIDTSREAYDRLKEEARRDQPSYKSIHYPDDPNILVHMRIGERMVDGKRALHVFEVQSDFAAEGRKKGFKDPDKIAKMKEELRGFQEERKKHIGIQRVRRHLLNDKIRDDKEFNDAHEAAIDLQDKIDVFIEQLNRAQLKQMEAVPKAPFVDSTGKYVMLAMKRLVRMAAENNFDMIVFDTGQISADRYDLSKHVKSIDWGVNNNDGTYDVQAELVKGGYYTKERLTEEGIAENFGKDIADKIVSDSDKDKYIGKDNNVLSGLDLKVGGEGMKGFYDSILPAEINKFFNKKAWGNAKVELEGVTVQSGTKKIGYGLPSIKEYEANRLNESETMVAYIKRMETEPKYAKLHVLKITPEMKSKALRQGMPLFATKEPTNILSKAFKKWFGKSVVKNEDSSPKVMYRGSRKSRTIFNRKLNFFTPDLKTAEDYTVNLFDPEGAPNITPVYIKSENPFDYKKKEHRDLAEKVLDGVNAYDTKTKESIRTGDWAFLETDYFLENVVFKYGFDGLYVHEAGVDNLAVFKPTQIKSIYNQGTWDATNPDIRFQTTEDFLKNLEIKKVAEMGIGRDNRETEEGFSVEDNSGIVDDFKYNIIDELSPISKVYKAIKKEIPEKFDFLLKERLRIAAAKEDIDISEKEYLEPMRKLIGENNLDVSDVDEAAYARHAPEANARLRLTNAKDYLNRIAKTQKGDKLKDEIANLDAQFELMDFPTKEIQESYNMILERELDNVIEKGEAANNKLSEYKTTLGDTPSAGELLKLDTLTKDLQKVMNELKVKKDWEAFSAKPSGMTDAEAAKLNKKWAGNKTIQEILSIFDRMNSETLDISYNAGRLSEEEYTAIKGTFEYYAPLYREGFEKDRAFSGIGGGVTNLGMDFKVRGGSTKRAVHLFANAIVNHEKTIINAKKAEVAQAFVAFVKDNPNKDFWDFEETKTVAKYDSHGNIKREPARNINDKEGGNEVSVRVNKKTYVISANPKNFHAMRIINIIRGSQSNTGPIVGALARLNRVLAAINTSLNPEFMLGNFTRDLGTAAFNLSDTQVSKMKGQIFKSVPKALAALRNAVRGDGKHEWSDIVSRYKKAGAKIGWIDYGQDIESRAKKLENQIDLFREGHATKKSIHALFGFIEDYNSVVENGIRLSTFKAGIDAGMSDAKAALMSKELTVNFTQRGHFGPVINSLYLFANAGIQGSTRIFRAFKNNPKTMAKLTGGTVLAATALAIANSSLGGDDEGVPYYDQIDEYIKARNMIIMIPGSKGDFIKIPLPWGYNVFWALGTEFGDAYTKKGYEPLEGVSRMLTTTMDAFNPLQSATLLQTLAPTIADPFVQVGENKTFFGSPLMPEKNIFDKTPEPDSERYWGSVRPVSREAARIINLVTGGDRIKPGAIDISPESLDLVFDTFTGGAGRFVSDTLGLPIKVAMGEFKASKTPLVRRMYGSKSEYKVTTDFRENISKVYQINERIKEYPEKAREFRKDKTYRLLSSAKIAEKRIRAINKLMKKAKTKADKEVNMKRIERIKQIFNNKFIETKE